MSAQVDFNTEVIAINATVVKQMIAVIHKLHPESAKILCEMQECWFDAVEQAHFKMEEGLEYERNKDKEELDPTSVMAGVKKTLDASGEN